jgi:hypothetical protein
MIGDERNQFPENFQQFGYPGNRVGVSITHAESYARKSGLRSTLCLSFLELMCVDLFFTIIVCHGKVLFLESPGFTRPVWPNAGMGVEFLQESLYNSTTANNTCSISFPQLEMEKQLATRDCTRITENTTTNGRNDHLEHLDFAYKVPPL